MPVSVQLPRMLSVASLAGTAASLFAPALPALAQPFGFDPVFQLSSLLPANGGDGTLGFSLPGIDGIDQLGRSVSGAGDVNGDGVDDLIVGARLADPGGRDRAGESYVVFGRTTGFPAAIDLSSLNGTTGFRIDGIDALDYSGTSVSGAGDVNGDGVDDLIVGARHADPDGRDRAGESYVVFGRTTAFPASVDLSSLNGSTGFRLDGIDATDFSGTVVSGAGDVNGDGINDLLVGAYEGDPPGTSNAGETYVVFGRTTGFAASIGLSSLDGTTGFRLDGSDTGDRSGLSASDAGDVNGDGVGDVIVGAFGADPDGRDRAGETYVVFGRTTGFPAAIDLSGLNGAAGFRLNGVDGVDYAGRSVSGAGDVNGDGVDDVIVGARGADPGGDSYAGESYVVFGRTTGFSAAINLSSLNGSTGFRLDGIDAGDKSGISVSDAGDVNGDGVGDVLIGASSADPGGDNFSGETYVVFGRTSAFPSSINLSSLDGKTGFRLDGIAGGDYSGDSVASAGDVNGDGIDDLIIGARAADPGGRIDAGECYVVFGRPFCRADWNNDHTLDAFDYDDFVSAYFDYVNNGAGFPDYNQDGYVDAFDYDDFVSDFFTGCG